MIKTLGIELKGNRSIYVALEGDRTDFKVIGKGFFEIANSKSQTDIRAFQQSWMNYLDENDFNSIGIKERIAKGRFAGGALSFKMEGLIQLSDYEIQIIHSAKLRSKLKNHDPAFGSIHSYQEEAARLAYYLMLS